MARARHGPAGPADAVMLPFWTSFLLRVCLEANCHQGGWAADLIRPGLDHAMAAS